MSDALIHRRQAITLPKTGAMGMIAIALIAIGLVRIGGTLPGAWQRNDFAHYYLSARAMLDGQNPYTTSLAPLCEELGFEHDARITSGTNPPPLTMLLSGVAWLPPMPAYAVWTVLQAMWLMGLFAMLMRRTSATPGAVWQWLAAGVVLCSTAVWSHFHYSQVQLLVAMLIAGAFFLKRDGRHTTAIALVAIATGLKLYPAVLLPWFVAAGHNGWRSISRRTLVAAGVGLAILLLSGTQQWRGFATHGLSTIQNSVYGSTSNYSLQSATVLLTGAVTGRPVPPGVLAWLEPVSRLLGVALIAGVYATIVRKRLDDWRAVGLLTIAMLLASPVCWSHYLVLLILPAWLLWAEVAKEPRTAKSTALALLAALCLMSEMDAVVPLGQMNLARTAVHFYPVAALLAFATALAFWRVGIGDPASRA